MDESDLPLSSSGRGGPRPPRRRAGENTPVVGPRESQGEPSTEVGRGTTPSEGDSTEVFRVAPRPRQVSAPRPTTPPDGGAKRFPKVAASQGAGSARPAAGATPVSRPDRKTFIRRRVTAVLAALLAVAVGCGVYVGCSGLNAIHNIRREGNLLPQGARAEKRVEGAMTILVVGTDKRPKGQPGDDGTTNPGNSDTMMLVQIPKDRKHVYIVSLPRDSWVPVPGHHWAKLNAAYNEGGSALAIKTFESFMDIHIDHVAMIDFEGFIKLTDAIGGVTVENKVASENMYYRWPEGPITIQGDEALSYVRQRYELQQGDLARTERQRAVMKSIIAKALSAGVVSNPKKLTDMMNEVSHFVTLDDTFDDATVRGLITGMDIKGNEDVRSIMLPIAGFTKHHGAEINVVDRHALEKLSHSMRSDTMEDYWATYDPNEMFTRTPGSYLPPQPWGPVPDEGLSMSALPTFPGEGDDEGDGAGTATPTATSRPSSSRTSTRRN